MSFHDRHLRVAVETKRSRAPFSRMRAALRGINQITLDPPPPNICFGSLHDDAKKIGADMRGAIKHLQRCE